MRLIEITNSAAAHQLPEQLDRTRSIQFATKISLNATKSSIFPEHIADIRAEYLWANTIVQRPNLERFAAQLPLHLFRPASVPDGGTSGGMDFRYSP
ncbi:hypothetical protein MCB86_03930 [Pseudomonas sp. KSR10]|uniref:hypothetical protein n=1 Tax=Pseudomonadaceae TaxID=135621 RepID=UPI0012D3DB39|nr:MULTISPECIES: hypothetical protein [Pseudomonadaceae]MCG6539222.1 hypothetical protein [Pseudomonas sp. KSR10]